jgi:hypothetical protein
MRETMKNLQDYDEALSSGGKENKLYTYNKRKKIICQEERKQGEEGENLLRRDKGKPSCADTREKFLAQLPGGMGEIRKKVGHWGRGGK